MPDRRFLTTLTATLLVALGASLPSAAQADILEALDRLRIAEGDVRVMTEVTLYEHDEATRQTVYEVYAGSDRRSLAIARGARDDGQKVLMLDDQFYLFMPDSRRQIRITPMQRLLGEASTGDISSLRWSEDYTLANRDALGDGRDQLTLEAARSGLSYQRLELVITERQERWIPLSATFYLPSGRVAKEATFEVEEDAVGELRLTAMVLQDRIQDHKRTVIRYLSVEPHDIPESWFNPAFLLRNTL